MHLEQNKYVMLLKTIDFCLALSVATERTLAIRILRQVLYGSIS